MKEITRIHLAATPFNIEIAAKKELEKYLDAIESALQADDDALREIEARIIELLSERNITGEKVITSADVEEIKQRLGSPADFLDDDVIEATSATAAPRKRLMRDNDAGLLGGVLAGIGAYVGMHPNWVRLIAVALTFVSLGTVLLIYIVLWIALPVAKTAAEKLQMAGKPVTLAALKEGADSNTSASGVKPLVIVFRVLLGLSFVGVAIGAASLTAMSMIAGVPAFIANGDLANEWLITAFVLFALSGILLTLLVIIAAYATFAWRFTKALGYTSLAIIVAGMVLFSVGVGAAFYGANTANEKIDELTKVNTTKLTNFQDVKRVVIASNELPVEYRQAAGQPRVEITTIEKNDDAPTAKVVREGDVMRIAVTDNRDDKSCFVFSKCAYGSDRVVIYGPVLTDVQVAKGTLTYDGEQQPNLSVDVRDDASFTVQDTAIENFTATIGTRASLDTQEASITNVMATTSTNAWLTVGVVSSLTLTSPVSCPANGATEVSAEQVEAITHNGIALTKQAETKLSCVSIAVRQLEEVDDSAL